MHSNQSQDDKLVAFKQKDKFSAKAWNDRGLHPSGGELCQQLTGLFNSCADNLINAVNANATGKDLKAVLKQALSTCNKPDYDTEGKLPQKQYGLKIDKMFNFKTVKHEKEHI
jgi:hypothetical protein